MKLFSDSRLLGEYSIPPRSLGTSYTIKRNSPLTILRIRPCQFYIGSREIKLSLFTNAVDRCMTKVLIELKFYHPYHNDPPTHTSLTYIPVI